MTNATSPAVTVAQQKGLIGWLYGHVRTLILLALAGVLITGALIYTGVLGIDRLDEEIRVRVETKIAGKYPHLTVKVESAQLLHGRGIQIRGLSISDPACDPKYAELVYVDEILAKCDTSLQELLTHEPHIKGLAIHRPRLRTTRLAGEWNTTKLLPLPKFSNTQCPTTIEDAAIEVCDPLCNAGKPLKLLNISVSLATDESTEALTFLPECQSPAPLKVMGQLACDHFRKLTLDGWFDPAGGAWAFRGEVDQLVITPALESSLPIEVPTKLLSLHDLHGKLSLTYEMTNQGLAGQPQNHNSLPFHFEAIGKLQEARLDDPRLPHPLTNLSAQIHCDDQGVQLQDISARCGTAKVFLSMQRTGWTAISPLNIKGHVTSLALDSAMADALSEKHRAVWDRFLPTGTIDVSFDFAFDGNAWQHNIVAEFQNVSVAFDKFPYRVTGAGGKAQLINRALILDTFGMAGRQRVTCKGELADLGPQFTGWIDIASDGPVAIDEKLLLAMDEKTQAIVRSLSPRGEGTFHFRIDRDDPEAPVQPYLAVALKDAALRYEKFPYPLDGVSGNITWKGGQWYFEKFEGANDGAYVLATGGVSRDVRGDLQLHLDFACADVPLEDDLKRALPEKMQTLWASLTPSGALDQVTASVNYNCDRKTLEIDVTGNKFVRPQVVDTRSVSLEPSWLPYRLDHVTGSFHYKNGDVHIKGLKAQHDRTRLAGDAFCQLNPDGGWSVNVERFHADRLDVNHQLLEALPVKASEVLTRLKVSGPLHLVGSGSITSDGRTAKPSQASWDVSIDLENGSLDAGAPLEHVHGGLRLVGSADSKGVRSVGELSVDSVMVHGVQLTQVIGPLSIDDSRVLLGAWAQQERKGPPRQITAKVFDGTLAGDVAVSLQEDAAFELQATLTDADVARVAAEKLPQGNKITGKAQGFIKLAGTRQGKHTWNGSGVVRLREADIYELPVMVALLKVLSVRQPDKTAFNTADLDYRIQGEHIYVDRLDFRGDAVTLKGSGEMDWQRHLNLQFYTMVGRDDLQLPVLRPILGEASRNLMLIGVTGTLDRPELKREAFPGLNETLNQIFPEAKLK